MLALRRLINKIEDVMAGIAVAMLVIMTFAIAYSVVMRYFFKMPVPWILEITTYFLLYTTFLGAPWLLRENGHVGVDLLLNALSKKKQSWFNIFTSLIGVIVSIVLVFFGMEVTIDHFQRQILVVNILSTPKYLMLGVIPLSGLFLFVEFFQKAFDHVNMLKHN